MDDNTANQTTEDNTPVMSTVPEPTGGATTPVETPQVETTSTEPTPVNTPTSPPTSSPATDSFTTSSSSPPQSKSRKTLLMIVIVAFLALSIPAAVFLSQQTQDIRQRAEVGTDCPAPPETTECIGNVPTGGPQCIFFAGQWQMCTRLQGNKGYSVGGNGNPNNPPCDCTSAPYTWQNYEYKQWWCFDTTTTCWGEGQYEWQCSTPPDVCEEPGPSSSPGGGGNPSPTPPGNPSPTPVPTPPTNPVAACQEVKAYEVTGDPNNAANWKRMSMPDLNALTSGKIVYFTCFGAEYYGANIDKARIRVNSTGWTVANETTNLKPKVSPNDANEYYIQYTIPAAVTTFTVKAEVHDVTSNTWY